MLRVDKRNLAAAFLRLCDDVERNGGFTRRFGTVDFGYPAARNTAYAERDVYAKRAGGDNVHLFERCRTQTHNRALAVFFVYLAYRLRDCLFSALNVGVDDGYFLIFFFCHFEPPGIQILYVLKN